MKAFDRTLRRQLAEYGATDIDIIPGGAHRRISLTWQGKRRSYPISSGKELNAVRRAIRQIKLDLGPKADEPEKQKLTLEDMLPQHTREALESLKEDLQEEKIVPTDQGTAGSTYAGKMALYKGGRLKFQIPGELVRIFSKQQTPTVFISRVGPKVWQIKKSLSGPAIQAIRTGSRNISYYLQCDNHALCLELETFGMSETTYTFIDGEILVSLPQTRSPIRDTKSYASSRPVVVRGFGTDSPTAEAVQAAVIKAVASQWVQGEQTAEPIAAVEEAESVMENPILPPPSPDREWIVTFLKKEGLTTNNMLSVLLAMRYIVEHSEYQLIRDAKTKELVLNLKKPNRIG